MPRNRLPENGKETPKPAAVYRQNGRPTIRSGVPATATQKAGRPGLGRRWLSLRAFSRKAAAKSGTLMTRRKLIAEFRRTLIDSAERPERMRQWSSRITVSLIQNTLSIDQRPRRSDRSLVPSACSADRLITPYVTVRVVCPSTVVMRSGFRKRFSPGHRACSTPRVLVDRMRRSTRPRLF